MMQDQRPRRLLKAALASCAFLLMSTAAVSQEDFRTIGGGKREVTPEVERATQRGLSYLAKQQHAEGYWLADIGFKVNADYETTKADAAHTGISALAIMAFLACGEIPGRGRYGDVVQRGLDYLIRHTNENGYISQNGTRMYSHAFATLCLAEAYGMTRSKALRDALQRSVTLISDSQNREGGWRYKPFAAQSDMSVTVCQVVALRAARNSGLHVPKSVIDNAVRYVRRSARSDRQLNWDRLQRDRNLGYFNDGIFNYQTGRNARASFPLTAAGVVTLYGAGVYEDPLIDRGLEFLKKRLSRYNKQYRSHYFFYYGNYYAVQAFYMAGGKRWNFYYDHIKDYLLRSQVQRKGPEFGAWTCEVGPGSNFGTAVATLILAIPYQYLPIFQK
ncbi:MAG: prenyltransferase [Planctomycetota bacterium]|nr:MAG: prenyltransferase [Planctomycetota bacterium]